MKKDKSNKESATDFIKGQIRILNGVVLLSVAIVFIMVLKLLYDLYTYLPMYSVLALLGIVVMLSIVGMFVARKIAGKAIRAIESYSNKLSTLLNVSHEVQKIKHSDLVLKKLAHVSRELTCADMAILCVVKNGTTIVMSTREDDRADGDTCRSPNHENAVEWAAVEWALDKNEVFLSDERGEQMGNAYWTSQEALDKDAAMCVVPILIGEKRIAALQLVKHEKGGFTAEEVDAVKYFIEHSVMAYENAMFHEDEKNFEIHITNLLVSSMENHTEKRGHSKNVAMYSLLIADGINMPEGQKAILYKAAMLHDIGALKLPLYSCKEDYLRHPQLGYEMLSPISFYSDITKAVLHHHEWYDGRGYPAGLKGADIPVESRIIVLAEAFDAILGSNEACNFSDIRLDMRPSSDELKLALSKIVKQSGTKFDPFMVKALLSRIDSESLCERSENPQFLLETTS